MSLFSTQGFSVQATSLRGPEGEAPYCCVLPTKYRLSPVSLTLLDYSTGSPVFQEYFPFSSGWPL